MKKRIKQTLEFANRVKEQGGGVMFVAGVIAEYNPFHNGHKYHLEQTAAQGADHIVAVMSGDVVQRGDVAIYSKYERAQIALKYGADLVLELSAPYSCAPAQVFAENAVRLLAGLGEGVVNAISFGCACDNEKLLEMAQEECEKLEDSDDFKQLLAQGLSYPAAMQRAVEKNCAEIKDILSDANNVLAIEYIKAAKRLAPWIKLLCVQRSGTFHDDMEINGDLASAMLIRKMIRYRKDLSKLVPELPSAEPAFLDSMDKSLIFRLMTADEDLVHELPFMSESLENRFFKAVEKCPKSVQEFEDLIKSRDITMARIRRLVMHLALGICDADMHVPVPYARVLALNERGREILAISKKRTLEYDTSLSRLESNIDCRRVAMLECNAVRLRELCAGDEFKNEYTRKIVLTK